MRKARKNRWKRACAAFLAATMVITMYPANTQAATSSSANADGTFSNPAVYADVPDIDIIRVEDAYYMVSTTMHLSPGCPVMKSTDLVNWEIVNYVYDILGDSDEMNLRNGKSMYGNGQWASSLKYHNGKYYVAFNSNTTGRAYIFTTDDIENGSWTKTELNGFFHDMSLFFDDNGKGYILYGGGAIKCAELSDDFKKVKTETEKTLFDVTKDTGETHFTEGLLCEGTHIMKKDGYYYVFNIGWPSGHPRLEMCHRSKTFPSTQWESKIILEANFQNNGVTAGVAQGAVIDTPDGKWYGFLFQDHGAIGRCPVLTDCTWKDGWPMLGKDGDGKTVEATMKLPVSGSGTKSLVKSDEFYNDAEHREFEAKAASAAAQAQEAKAVEEPAAEAQANVVEQPLNAPAAEAETEMETVELIGNGDFESGNFDGWEGLDKGVLEVVSEDTEAGTNKVLKVKERKNSSSSAKYDLTGKIEKGTTYTIKFKIKYDGENVDATKKFVGRFQNSPVGASEPWMHRPEIGEAFELKKGEWKELSFTYTAADRVVGDKTYEFGTGSNYFFIEGNDWANDEVAAGAPQTHLMDYYLDDVSITYQKPKEGGDKPGDDNNPGGDTSSGDLIQLITNGDVESGTTDGWTTTPGEKACNLEAVKTDKANGEYSLFVSGRTSMGAGASQDISGKMEVGKKYTISGKLKYTTGPATKQFYVTIQHGPDYQYRQNMISINAKKGEWVEFKGEWTAADKGDFAFLKDQVHVFVETPWAASIDQEKDLMDYYLDDFSMTVPSDNMAGDGSFNSGAGEWGAFENQGKAEVVANGRGGADDKCLKISGRKQNWNGAGLVFGDKMTPGNTYNIKAWVKYDAATPAQQKFYFTMKGCKGSSTEPSYSSMAEGTAKSGEWTEFTGKWTMPEDANSTYPWTLYVNTDEKGPSYMDFYLDDVVITEEVPDKEPAENGEHDYNGSNLDLVWQWNHNPNNNNWSLTERDGWLRLKTSSKATSLLNARNTLTQRTFGPACSGTIKMDVSKMEAGDVAGLGSLSFKYGYIAVKKEANGAKLVMVDASANDTNTKEDKPVEKASVDCTGTTVYLKEDFNFAGNANGSDKDTVSFYYSFDGRTWKQLGDKMKMSYELVHFMGSKFAIFNYATKKTGGYVDVDYFRVSDKLTGAETLPGSALAATMSATKEVSGVIGTECEAKLSLDALKAEGHKNLQASIAVPSILEVTDVVFNTAAIKGKAEYTYRNGRLTIKVTGDDISFNAADKSFATIKLRLRNYATKDEAVELRADYIQVDGVDAYNTDNCKASVNLKYLDTKAIAKKLGYGNPIFTQAFGADPYAMEYDGRVYVYMTADAYQYDANGNLLDNGFGYINTYRVVSSADLMNWTDHGEIAVAGPNGAAKWAKNSWAPAIAHKTIDGKEKFFLYFADGGSGIGVLEGDSPLGPWRDPLGQKLFPTTYPTEGVPWCFDPAVLVDSKGDGYIYFGGGIPGNPPSTEQINNPNSARVAKLAPDMIHVEEKNGKPYIEKIDAPCMFEDSGIFEYDGKYYYSYCSNFSGPHLPGNPGFGNICYMVSDNPMGPFTYAGEIFSNPSVWFGTGGNNHHATFVFENKSYFIYHAQTVSKEEGKDKGYRSTHIDNIEMNKDGSIKAIKGTREGISQLHVMNPYERIEGETIAWNAGVKVEPCKEPGKLYEQYNTALTDLQDKDWTSVAQLEFGEYGATGFNVYAASAKGGKIEVRMDSPEGALAGTIDVPATGGEDKYKLVEGKLDTAITGTRNVFLVFRGSATENIMNVDYFEFAKASAKDQLTLDISKAEQLLAGLTGDEKTKLQAAINAAKAVLDKAGATQAEIEKALADLQAAVDVVQKPAQDKLGDKIAEAEKLLAKLSGTAKTKLQAAIDEAKKVLNDPKADEQAFNEALAKLSQSIKEAEGGTSVKPQPQPPKVNEVFTASNGLKYKVTAYSSKAKNVTVTGISKKVTSITVPSTVSYKNVTFKVTAVGSSAFTKQSTLKSATIGKYVTSIGTKAFYNDKKLAKVTFKGTAVKKIGKDAFKGIKKDASLVMAKSFTYKSVKYKITKSTTSEKRVTATGTTNKNITTLSIPSTVKYNGLTFKVTSVGKSAFKNKKKLKSVTIGKYVKSIGSSAFLGDKKLAKVKFSGTAIKSIGKNAFKGIKKNATFSVKKSKKAYYTKLLKKAGTKNFKVK